MRTDGTPNMEELIKRMVVRHTGAHVEEVKIENTYWYVKVDGKWLKVSDILKSTKQL